MRVKSYNGRFKVFGTHAKYFRYEESKAVIIGIQADVILDNNQKLAADYLVGMEIINSLWSKNNAIYGFLGGTASTHKWNWKDMRGLDVSFRITWHGIISHTDFGIQGDGKSGSVANTYINASSLSLSSRHLCVYTNLLGSFVDTNFSIEIGSSVLNVNNFRLHTYWSDNSSSYEISSASQISSVATNGLGLYIGNTHNGFNKLFYNYSILGSNNYTSTSLPNATIGICGDNRFPSGISNVLPSNKRISFASIGGGLTDAEMNLRSNVIKSYNKILNRA